jgi:hypothetical protein
VAAAWLAAVGGQVAVGGAVAPCCFGGGFGDQVVGGVVDGGGALKQAGFGDVQAAKDPFDLAGHRGEGRMGGACGGGWLVRNVGRTPGGGGANGGQRAGGGGSGGGELVQDGDGAGGHGDRGVVSGQQSVNAVAGGGGVGAGDVVAGGQQPGGDVQVVADGCGADGFAVAGADAQLAAHIDAMCAQGVTVPDTDSDTAAQAADFLLHPPAEQAAPAVWLPGG